MSSNSRIWFFPAITVLLLKLVRHIGCRCVYVVCVYVHVCMLAFHACVCICVCTYVWCVCLCVCVHSCSCTCMHLSFSCRTHSLVVDPVLPNNHAEGSVSAQTGKLDARWDSMHPAVWRGGKNTHCLRTGAEARGIRLGAVPAAIAPSSCLGYVCTTNVKK